MARRAPSGTIPVIRLQGLSRDVMVAGTPVSKLAMQQFFIVSV
jgi:hypothetical protein